MTPGVVGSLRFSCVGISGVFGGIYGLCEAMCIYIYTCVCVYIYVLVWTCAYACAELSGCELSGLELCGSDHFFEASVALSLAFSMFSKPQWLWALFPLCFRGLSGSEPCFLYVFEVSVALSLVFSMFPRLQWL